MKLKALREGGWLHVRLGRLPKGIFVLHALQVLERHALISHEASARIWDGQFQLLQVEALKADDSQDVLEAVPTQQMDFKSLLLLLGPDMAFTGQKAVLVQQIQALHASLDETEKDLRKALEQTALSLLEHPLTDFFHHGRAMKRLHPFFSVKDMGRTLDEAACRDLALTLCKDGLMPVMDNLCQQMQQGATKGDLLEVLCLASINRLAGVPLDVRSHACWALVYLAAVAQDLGELCPSAYVQAAALLNFLPDAPEALAQKPASDTPLSADGFDALEAQWTVAWVEGLVEAPWLVENRTRLMTLGALLELKAHIRRPVYMALLEVLAKTFAEPREVAV